ncbi:MAG: ComEC/Rec2 family competence protein, partial [Angelakisella sp.]
IISLGCLTAIIASGLFLSRLEGSRVLIDTVQTVNGTIFYNGDRQMATVTLPDGQRHVTSLFPPADGLETGDSFVGNIKIKKVEADRWQHLLSGGILLEASPEELTYLNGEKPPLAIGGMLLRQRLTHELRTLSPIPATDITVAILFSLKDHLPPDLRTAFSKSGMSHLMAVSGLHLSILVWTLVAGVKGLGGGKALQALCGSAAALLMFFTAGMTPSVFRAALMILLTLFAELLSRKSDGLTSLSVAAVLLVAVSPPVLTDLSFLLSFFSVGGILLLSPRFFTVAERFWVSRFAVCGKAAKWVLSALSVSAAAQLATAPIVAFSFGSLPLLGILINLVAIPLVYPVLVFGFAACLLLPLSHGLAALLLLPANLCSALLGIIARFSAKLPFCALRTLFPMDFLPLLFLVAGAACIVIFPHRVRLLHRAIGVCLSCALGSAVLAAFISYNSIIIASS